MKPQTPPIDKLIKQYIPSWEKRRREIAARENNSAQPVNSKPTAPAKPERVKQAETPYVYKHDSDTGIKEGMLKMKHAYTWMKDANLMPIPEMLFDEFWRKGELCVLFSDGDIDRSVLVVQIADSISRGVGAGPFKMQGKSQPVMYVDFEHSAKQFEGRYSKNYKEHYPFHPNFLRLEMNPDFADDGRTSFEDNIINSITRTIEISDAKILVIDNLTSLGENMGKASKTKTLMVKLNALKIKYGLSILVLATTIIKPGKHITRADVQKRSGLIFLCDSAFCIGESTIAHNRLYLKQLRCRATEMVYTRDNVCVCEIKKESNFKQFAFVQYSNERIELLNQKHRQHLTDYLKIMELKKQGSSNVDIARKYGVSEGSIRLWLKRGEDKYGVIPGYGENATNPTTLRHCEPLFGVKQSPIQDEIASLSPARTEMVHSGGLAMTNAADESATNPTRGVNQVPGGVLDPFGALPGKEDLETDLVNAEGVQNPSGVKNATNPTSDTTRDPRLAPLAFGEGPGVRLGNENATNPTSTTSEVNQVPGGVINPFGAIPRKEDLEAVFLNAEGVVNPSGLENATNPTNREFINTTERELLNAAA